MNLGDDIAVSLLLLFAIVIGAGALMVFLTLLWRRHQHETIFANAFRPAFPPGELHIHPFQIHRPTSWLAVRSKNLVSVQSALALHNPHPCSWVEGLNGETERKLFISPPIAGWVLVVGSGLPDPAEDVDVCYRFLADLSRKLGHVQFFCANRVLGHHAWIRMEMGRVLRGYAWAGRTLWYQGRFTPEEADLGMQCFGYDAAERGFGRTDFIASNVDKVSLLAARWSLDPAMIDERFFEEHQGIAGELSARPH